MNENKLEVFTNADFGSVRTMLIDNEPYFVGKDVAEILGYSNTRDALAKRVDDEDKGVANCDTLGGTQEMVIINESGLYSLILSSKLPTAKKFKRWVTSEVLPAIRKHGVYAEQPKQLSPIEMIASIANNAVEMERKQKLIEAKQAEQAMQIEGLQQKSNETAEKLNSALDVFSDDMRTADWKDRINKTIRGICKNNGLNYMAIYDELYKELEQTAHCNLKMRKKYMQERMKKSGAKYRDWTHLPKIMVIEDDAKLKAIFDGIVKKFAAKYIQHNNTQIGMFECE